MRDSDLEIQALIAKYKRLENVVNKRMQRIFADSRLIHIHHRVKTIASIKGKLERKEHYSSVQELNDILGFRVICYLSADIDSAANLIAENFRIKWDKSKDKRKLIDARSFGYVALHYICALPDCGNNCEPESGDLSGLWFEVQIKTILQHSWAEIEHDLGYKSEIEVPRDIRRSFSKAASLLETADDIFSDIKSKLEDYALKIKQDIKDERLDDIFFDKITLEEFTSGNPEYLKLLHEIAAITDAEITKQSLDGQLALIDFLGIKSFGDMVRLINKEHDTAMGLARKLLEGSGLDEIAYGAGYHFLFRAKLINGGYSTEKIREFFSLMTSNEKLIESNTQKIIQERERAERAVDSEW
ncbi:MAG: hypothetical protein IJT58_04945 [Synergistaceae bacterium]|nr:hypothetical protein [Synergistaceae bacterium]